MSNPESTQPKIEETAPQISNQEQNNIPLEDKKEDKNIPNENNTQINNVVQPIQENEQKKEEKKKEQEIKEPKPINPQENQEQNEIQEIEEMKPEPPKVDENKIKFTHPMNNYCSPESIKEIEECPKDKIFAIVTNRFNGIKKKLDDILQKHETFNLISLYLKIAVHFKQSINYRNNPKDFFQSKDPNGRQKISDFDFSEVLNNMLNCNLTTDQIFLILRSLKQKTDTLYSYEEFIKNVYSIQNRQAEFVMIYKDCSFYFDDYIYSFRHFIQDNKIDYKSAFTRACTGITMLNYELFLKFLKEIGFKLGNEKEIQHLFCSLSEGNYMLSWNNQTFFYFVQLNMSNLNGQVSQQTLFKIAELNDLTEDDFCKAGVAIKKGQKNSEWTKYIRNYTEESKKMYKKQYETFRTVFINIQKKCKENDIDNLTKYYVNSDMDISDDGDIDINEFKDSMNNIGVSYTVQLDTLVNKFKNMNKKPREVIKLVEFLSIYNLFIDEDKESQNENDKKEKKSIKELDDDKEDYVYKNAHRRFTQNDLEYIEEICQGLAEIIIGELHDSVTNFFQKKDKNNQGYLLLDDFKEIMEKDLAIDYKSDLENLQIFFDFITSDKMVEGSDIVEVKKLIKTIIRYSGKDKPEEIEDKSEDENNKINNKMNNKKNNMFEEEEELKGTNAPNLNNSNDNINNKNFKEDDDDNEEEIIDTSTPLSFEKIMAEFAHYLFNNHIRFNTIFPSIDLEKIINNQTITEDTLRSGFDNANYHISDKEINIIMTHFDPVNKSKILVEDLKHEISNYEPKYFDQRYQKRDSNNIENQLNKVEVSASFGKNVFNTNLMNGMDKIKNYLERNKLSTENFFYGKFCGKKSKNENLVINEDMWRDAFIPKDKATSNIVPYLQNFEVDAIYKAMDPKLTNSIILGNIISFFNKYIKKDINLINIEDQSSLNESIKNELKTLFDNFDTNKNDTISSEDFYKCLKSVDHLATRAQANNILSQKTKQDHPSVIERKIFDEIMYNYIQKELVIQKEEKDYIINLFKEADIDKNGYLTRNQIKYLIKNKIGCNLTDVELDEIFDKVDIRQENEIDIRDFVFLLDNINTVYTQKQEEKKDMINTNSNQEDELIPIMNLNLNLNMHRKIRPKDFISLYSDLPLSFIPSFIREEQQKNNLLPSSCLKPLTKDDIIYEDISPYEALVFDDKKELNPNMINNKDYSGVHTYKKLNQFTPLINCKIYFDSYASGVSSPDETLFESPNSQFKVVGRLLKISLFNNIYKIFVGNAVSIDCIYKKEYQDRWYFEDSDSKYNNNIIIRYNNNDINNIDVVFEFVLVIQKKVEQTLYTIETSCGWCAIPMKNLQISRKEKLKIVGGSPLGESDISEYDIRKKRIGFLPKLATLFEGQIKSECPIRVKVFNDLSNDEKKYINYLPSLIVCHSLAMSMISIYRQEIGEYILNHKDYLLKCIKDEFDLANMFCKIADVPDAFRVMNEIWKEIIIDGSPSDKKNDESYLRLNFEIFVKKINSILYAEKFKYNPLDPTELPRGDIKLMQDRDILLNSALRSDREPKFNKLGYKMDDYSYKPFTMDEINGQKGNTILEKIDEIITSISV